LYTMLVTTLKDSKTSKHVSILYQLLPLLKFQPSYTLLDFCVTFGNLFFLTHSNPRPGFIHTVHKVFHEAQLYVQKGADKFSPEEQVASVFV